MSSEPARPRGEPADPLVRTRYGGFWRRLSAAALDGLLVNIVVDAVVSGITTYLAEPPRSGRGLRLAVKLLVAWLYCSGMESSPRQATLGKLAMGLRVTDLAGHRIGFGQATLRHWAKIFSGVASLGIGYLMIAFTRRKQALHDQLAGCLVVRTRPD